jgi:L-malate glycosyltransferase
MAIVRDFIQTGTEVKLLKLDRKTSPVLLIFKLYQHIRIANPTYIHVQYMNPGALPIIAARFAGFKKLYATVHQPCTQSHGRLARLILRSAAVLTSKFIAVSQNAEKSWFGNSHLLNEITPLADQPSHFTIHNAVDIIRIEEILSRSDCRKVKDDLDISYEKLLIGTVSRLSNEKGVDILIDAFFLLMKSNINTHLLIVGDGPDKEKLMNQTVRLGIGNSVTFTGSADWEKAIKLIGILDIVVVPSRFEGFGLTAAEAMAAGKPVIASDSFGLSEVVVNEETGLLFPPEDSEMLGKQLVRLCESRAIMEEFGRNGKERCQRLFDFDLFRKRISALYGLASIS